MCEENYLPSAKHPLYRSRRTTSKCWSHAEWLVNRALEAGFRSIRLPIPIREITPCGPAGILEGYEIVRKNDQLHEDDSLISIPDYIGPFFIRQFGILKPTIPIGS